MNELRIINVTQEELRAIVKDEARVIAEQMVNAILKSYGIEPKARPGLLQGEISGRNKVEKALRLSDHIELDRIASNGVLGKSLWRRGNKGIYTLHVKKGIPRYRYYLTLTKTEKAVWDNAGCDACERRWCELEKQGLVA